MKTGTSRASARAEIDLHLLDFGIAASTADRPDSTSVAPSCVAEHRLDLARRGASTIGCSVFEPGGIHHRLAHDADPHAFERARAPDARTWLA